MKLFLEILIWTQNANLSNFFQPIKSSKYVFKYQTENKYTVCIRAIGKADLFG